MPETSARWLPVIWIFLLGVEICFGQSARDPLSGAPFSSEALLVAYFQDQVRRIEERRPEDVRTLEEWESRRPRLQRELWEMLGLWPLPERTDLKVTVTGRVEQPEFVVEKLHFQSLPGLYVTANLYLPRHVSQPVPAVLYVCGHATIRRDGIAYGSKASYQHHPAWFARNGFVCLILDTLQFGEIEGLHHGTYREGLWWWINRGYTPAGVETWNSIRALDYLESRPEVDPLKIGITGRSGGGAYSWWVAALDERVRAVVPVAGITDLRNHVVDGVIEGHCDCMYPINRYGWDFATLAALVAPRPLLLANSDKDPIFPLDGVLRVYWKIRRLYQLYEAENHLGLLITEGPHRDTQAIRLPTFEWMTRWLKGEDAAILDPGTKHFEPEELKVFAALPLDQLNTRIHETFIPASSEPSVPNTREAWESLRRKWLEDLREQSFSGWPREEPPLNLSVLREVTREGLRLREVRFLSQEAVPLRVWILSPEGLGTPRTVELRVLDESGWQGWRRLLTYGFGVAPDEGQGTASSADPAGVFGALQKELASQSEALALLVPRGGGPAIWAAEKETHIRRRFVLVGQTLDGMRVWDTLRGLQALGRHTGWEAVPLRLAGEGAASGIALYASLFAPSIAELELDGLPSSHREGPVFINISRILDIPQALAMAAEDRPTVLYTDRMEDFEWALRWAESLNLEPGRLRIESAQARRTVAGNSRP